MKHNIPGSEGYPCLLNWSAVRATPYEFKIEGCDWITDASLQECFLLGNFEDVNQPLSKESHHAARIASLIALLEAGQALNPMWIRVDTKIRIMDGSHRLRAYQYLGRTDAIPAIVTGNIDVLRHAMI